MMIVRRTLFWKLYLTLLSSLVVVTLLMGGLWWFLGEMPHERPAVLRLTLPDQRLAEQPPGPALDHALAMLGEATGADLSLYGGDETLIAARGTPMMLHDSWDPSRWPRMAVRIDLPDNRTLLMHLKPPVGRRAMGIITAMLIAAGGVGLAAFPLTARLTCGLEGLRSGMERWGRGDVWARVDGHGTDEVAIVARTFNAAAERINALLTAQRALLANASHELRSPLARLRMAVDLWQTQPDAARRDEIIRNLVELDGLVEEILLSSRLEHPSSAVGRIEPVDLLGLSAEEAVRAGARLEGEPVEVEGSEMLLRRLIRNLLENGIKHGRAPVHITVLRQGGEACLTVADAGRGIAPEERERVFEPFYRPATHGEEDGGWGLGLSLVRQIASRHHGRVTCEQGETATGSRFVVLLPARPVMPEGFGDSVPERAPAPVPESLAERQVRWPRTAA